MDTERGIGYRRRGVGNTRIEKRREETQGYGNRKRKGKILFGKIHRKKGQGTGGEGERRVTQG